MKLALFIGRSLTYHWHTGGSRGRSFKRIVHASILVFRGKKSTAKFGHLAFFKRYESVVSVDVSRAWRSMFFCS